MARSAITRRRNIEGRPKVKTGCATCRIRKIKCDEDKPFCQKCVSTGRTCDGYASPFRSCTIQSNGNIHPSGTELGGSVVPSIPSTFVKISPRDIELLDRSFSTKTMFDIQLGCDEEARQILQASLTDPPIRHAVLSLRALRDDLETSGHDPASAMRKTQCYGLKQYNIALGGLISNLSFPTSKGLKSALLCCQIFISIEQVRNNWAAVAQHIIRGLGIMREYCARPGVDTEAKLVPAHHDQLPLLDVYLIKLFAAPCKYAELPATTEVNKMTFCLYPTPPSEQSVEARNFRIIAPDMRTELVRIAMSSLEFLGKVSQVESVGDALQLLSEKAALLKSLESWLMNLEQAQVEKRYSDTEPLSVSFSRIFHVILKIILLGALDASPNLHSELQTESTWLQTIANDVGERLSTYRTRSRTP